jgi:hypothetical protein
LAPPLCNVWSRRLVETAPEPLLLLLLANSNCSSSGRRRAPKVDADTDAEASKKPGKSFQPGCCCCARLRFLEVVADSLILSGRLSGFRCPLLCHHEGQRSVQRRKTKERGDQRELRVGPEKMGWFKWWLEVSVFSWLICESHESLINGAQGSTVCHVLAPW